MSMFPHPAEYDALLRLFDAPTATPTSGASPPTRSPSSIAWSRSPPVLLIRDATHLDFSGHATLHLAWLGGYMKDHPDRHPPGWQTIWRGWLQFQTILQYELSRSKM